MNIAAINLVTLISEFIQTVTGFEAGIFNMIVLLFSLGLISNVYQLSYSHSSC